MVDFYYIYGGHYIYLWLLLHWWFLLHLSVLQLMATKVNLLPCANMINTTLVPSLKKMQEQIDNLTASLMKSFTSKIKTAFQQRL